MDDNKRFWSRTARIYEGFNQGGKAAKDAYSETGSKISEHLSKDMNVLELAAGPGIFSGRIAENCNTLEATDFSPEMIAQARKKVMPPNVTFAVADATNLRYRDDMFDAVVIANALHIMPDPARAIGEIKRVLKADGVMIAPTFIRDDIRYKLMEKLMEVFGFKTFNKWTHQSYQDFLREQGMEICDEAVITGHNFPISFVVCKRGSQPLQT